MVLLAARRWIDFSAPDLPARRIEEAAKWSNVGLAIALAVVAAVLLGAIIMEARRWLRHTIAQPEQPAGGLPDRSAAR